MNIWKRWFSSSMCYRHQGEELNNICSAKRGCHSVMRPKNIVLAMKDKWWIAVAPSDHFWEWCLFCAKNSAKMLQEKEICFAVIHFLSSESVGPVIHSFLVILVCSGTTTPWPLHLLQGRGLQQKPCSKKPLRTSHCWPQGFLGSVTWVFQTSSMWSLDPSAEPQD